MWYRSLFVALLFASSGLAAAALVNDAYHDDPGPPAHQSPMASFLERDWPHVASFSSQADDAGWFMVRFTADQNTTSLRQYEITGQTEPARSYWKSVVHAKLIDGMADEATGGAGGSYHSCDRHHEHLMDCPLERFAFDGAAGSGGGTTREGTHQYLFSHYGGLMRFTLHVHSEHPVELADTAEGPSRLLVLTPPRDAPPGRHVLETTVELDQPFIADFRSRDAFHVERLDVMGPDGDTQTREACDFGGAPLPRGGPGTWTFQVTGTLTDDEPLAAALVGLTLGSATEQIAPSREAPCGHMSAQSVSLPP